MAVKIWSNVKVDEEELFKVEDTKHGRKITMKENY